jgi:tol-pal system protein YbgF
MLIASFGCQATRHHEQTIIALEREVARLRSERANLDARSNALDDKVLVLEKKLEKCTLKDAPSLKVVRLTREDEAAALEADELSQVQQDDADAAATRPAAHKKEKRPVLVLNNSKRRSQTPTTRTGQPQPSNGISSSDFGHLGADNLGVVHSEEGSDPDRDAKMNAFNDAYRAYSNKTYDTALAAFARFVNANPSHPFADNAIYWRGECFLAQGKLPKAIGEFERLTRRYPKSEKVAAAVYRLGFVYDKLRDFGKAADYYFDVVERYPGSDEARRASRRVAEIKNRNGNVDGLLPTSAAR